MECRSECGACCIAPSITSAIEGMPEGKKAGKPCLHLDENFLCRLWGTDKRPAFCDSFQAEKNICGDSRIEALDILTDLEQLT